MKLAVAIIHGIGNQQDARDAEGQHAFAQGLIRGLRKRLDAEAVDIAFQSLYWANVLDKRELAYLERLEQEPVRCLPGQAGPVMAGRAATASPRGSRRSCRPGRR